MVIINSLRKMESHYPLLEYFDFLQGVRAIIRSNDEFNHHCNMFFILTSMFLLMYFAFGAFMKVIEVDEISIFSCQSVFIIITIFFSSTEAINISSCSILIDSAINLFNVPLTILHLLDILSINLLQYVLAPTT